MLYDLKIEKINNIRRTYKYLCNEYKDKPFLLKPIRQMTIDYCRIEDLTNDNI